MPKAYNEKEKEFNGTCELEFSVAPVQHSLANCECHAWPDISGYRTALPYSLEP